ncbi:DUF6731 family protein [Maribacter aquivivus]|uniref:DUF6731 family protein n=1 Tax=Maribacter aquivivus TaxID=228958 RepID=UPI002490F7EF|nr:DUF6731 family protein [Maribacter aquivivus]
MAKKIKKTKINFYRILPSVKTKENTDKVRKAFEFSLKNHKDIKHNDGNSNIYQVKCKHDRYVYGTFIYTQTENIPPKFKKATEEASKVDLNGFDGLGFDCSFVFDKKLMIFAMESKRPGTSLGAIEYFLYNNYDLPKFDFEIIIRPDQYNRFLNAKDFYKLRVKIAKPNNPTDIGAPKLSGALAPIQLLEMSNAATADIVLSRGRDKSESLTSNYVKEIVDWGLKTTMGREKVQELEVTATLYDSDSVQMIDLITERLYDWLEIERNKRIGEFSIAEKYNNLEGIYLRFREALEHQFLK